jgi:orotidine-5'-phosphate decarboxylase
MDCKINDIGNTNSIIAKSYFKAGFDAVTANPFVGWEEGLRPVFEAAKLMGKGVLLLVFMSHKAAWEGYGQTILGPKKIQTKHQYTIFAEKSLAWQADGVIVGATYPKIIKNTFDILKTKIPIYSPGIGSQGGKIKEALSSGAHYLIVGRTITEAQKNNKTYAEAAREIRDEANKH